MAFELFGFQISKKKSKRTSKPTISSPVTTVSDGSSVVYNDFGSFGQASGYFGYQYDLDSTINSANQLINQYRTISNFPEVDTAIEAIVNEAIIVEQGASPVSLNLDKLPDDYQSIRETLTTQFQHILNLLQFNDNCHDIFKRWYVDGRLYYYVMVDPDKPQKGIIDLRYIDPRKIQKVTEYKRENQNGVDLITDEQTYYVFNDKGLQDSTQGLKLSPECVIQAHSGLVDPNTGDILSHLFKSIKPANQLKMIEDALVIYRITRAPERRVFYVDVGNLPSQKAEQYVNAIMNKFRNKVVYDAATGEIKNNRQYLSMMEDFWLPRREGGKATEITTLPGGQGLNEIADIRYFQAKLYQSLNVPRQRLLQDNLNSLGRPNEVSREEIAFSKFIQRLRNRFNILFKEALRIQLICTNTISNDDWEKIRNLIYFEYQHDNYFEELKRIEVFNERMAQLQTADSFKGIYFSKKYIVSNVLELSVDEWEEIQQQIKQEKIEEAQEEFEIEQLSNQYQQSASEDQDDSQDQSEDDQDDSTYDDFVSGEDQSDDTSEDQTDDEQHPDVVTQTDDTTDTLNDKAKPNPGEDRFVRPAAPGLVVTK